MKRSTRPCDGLRRLRAARDSSRYTSFVITSILATSRARVSSVQKKKKERNKEEREMTSLARPVSAGPALKTFTRRDVMAPITFVKALAVSLVVM